ncbi:hypothetical protein BDN70DRAFT_982877 [Pholiota conissans]|uniref:Uncharacterized protein n=1 Tax=Pholiota conissans TaxID=109636 RepID=A0A9P5ZBF3_9AGAR|nr:hypothetical protein BDN70DRAFT_982877 [Pholiota conissans]
MQVEILDPISDSRPIVVLYSYLPSSRSLENVPFGVRWESVSHYELFYHKSFRYSDTAIYLFLTFFLKDGHPIGKLYDAVCICSGFVAVQTEMTSIQIAAKTQMEEKAIHDQVKLRRTAKDVYIEVAALRQRRYIQGIQCLRAEFRTEQRQLGWNFTTLDQRLTMPEQRVEKRLTAFERRVQERLTAFEQRVEERLTAFERRVQDRLTAFEQRIEQRVEEHLSAFERRIKQRVEECLITLEQRIEQRVQHCLTTLQPNIEQRIQQRLTALQPRIKQCVQQRLTELQLQQQHLTELK